jgi:uncharacterized membrane protein HdeD (DUF308 family)
MAVQVLLPRRQATLSTLGLATVGLALLALLTPFSESEFPASRVGMLIAFAAGIEMLHALRRSTTEARRQATIGAVISMAIALLLINAPFVAAEALKYGIAGWFGLDAVRYAIAAGKAADADRRPATLAALGNAAVGLAILFARGWGITWVVSIAGAARIFGVSWNIMTAPVYSTAEADTTVIDDFGLGSQPEARAMAAEVETAAAARAPVDRGWTLSFIATLFAIHIGRMQVDLTLLGLIAPAVAILGDMVIAVLITLLVVNPLYLIWRRPTRLVVRPVWRLYVRRVRAGRQDAITRISATWLKWRLRSAIRLRAARYSIPAALNQGLQTGLPLAAIIAATVPIWGMSWYFDTENWAAGMWNSWASSRTDTWREAMVRAVLAPDGGRMSPASFAVQPDGIASGDFSFIVIGDPGEGDASQHVLRDQILTVANSPDVRFVVVSSDVVYPTGAMKDYEAKFWLPFKGVSRPVYAIPGNHDWYDALEAFAATFFQPDAARASIRARAEADLRVTSTTDDRIDALVGGAAALRQAYGVPTGFQRAPFFELQTDRFALIAIDTGILRRTDPAQDAWLRSALDRSSGKLTMAVLGHPFIAGGHDVSTGDEEFTTLRQLLRDRGVAIVMAGDTHDLEYYAEPGASGSTAVHHFVNGGGGAYLSFGTSLDWPAAPPTTDWAYYPDHDAVTRKIEAATPWWKRPAWWWTRQFGAWPFTAEWLSAAFDYNVAPFFQSFVEVKVERSAGRVRIIPYGVHGRLAWRDVAFTGRLRAPEVDQAFVEWIVPMPQARGSR